MFSVTGVVLNTFTVPGSEKYPDTKYNVQILGKEATKDGQIRNGLVSFSVPSDCFKKLADLVGSEVSFPCGLFVTAGRLQPFFPKSVKPDEIKVTGIA